MFFYLQNNLMRNIYIVYFQVVCFYKAQVQTLERGILPVRKVTGVKDT